MTLVLRDRVFECSGCKMVFNTIPELERHWLNCIDKWDEIRQRKVRK